MGDAPAGGHPNPVDFLGRVRSPADQDDKLADEAGIGRPERLLQNSGHLNRETEELLVLGDKEVIKNWGKPSDTAR